MGYENAFYSGARDPLDTLGPGERVGLVVDLPSGVDPILHVWGDMVPGIGPAAARYAASVYEHSTLGLREMEAARLRIAQVNGCELCRTWRTERDGATVEDGFEDAVREWRTTPLFDERTRLAAEYAERYALDHLGLDQGFWTRAKAWYTDRELVELTLCLGAWLAFGRVNRVLGLDTCALPHPRPDARPDAVLSDA